MARYLPAGVRIVWDIPFFADVQLCVGEPLRRRDLDDAIRFDCEAAERPVQVEACLKVGTTTRGGFLP